MDRLVPLARALLDTHDIGWSIFQMQLIKGNVITSLGIWYVRHPETAFPRSHMARGQHASQFPALSEVLDETLFFFQLFLKLLPSPSKYAHMLRAETPYFSSPTPGVVSETFCFPLLHMSANGMLA